MANAKVQLNGTSTAQDTSLQSQISASLLQNGGIKRIQQTLQQRLDEEGWSQSLREYVVRLFRSGEATTYEEALVKVMAQVKRGGSVNGGGDAGVDLRVPKSAMEGGAEAVRRELEGVCVVGEK